jgi:tRNA U34 2-thiouridine synthase MnmA/TrmU
LDEAHFEVCEEKTQENKFVTGVPRDQKWVRVEPSGNLTSERIKQIAKENNLSVNPQKDGRLLVFGQPVGIKDFVKKMTAETTKK